MDDIIWTEYVPLFIEEQNKETLLVAVSNEFLLLMLSHLNYEACSN
jgi:hypothetical protein